MNALKYIIFILAGCVPFFTTAQLQEKVYIRTDKVSYQAGESIWMSIDITTGNNPDTISKIVYAELVSADNKPVAQVKISVKNAFGNGVLILPADVRPGLYTLRGYTNWMKNYGSDGYFTRVITVYNILLSGKQIIKPEQQQLKTLGDLSIKIETDKPVYSKRDKITLGISAIDHTLKDVSVSVFRIDSLQDYEGIAEPSTESRAVVKRANKFFPEYYGHIISGKVTDTRDGKFASGINCYLSVIGSVNRFYTGTSDSLGNVFFELKDVYDDNKIVLQTADSNYRAELNNSFSTEYSSFSMPKTDTLDIDTTILGEHIVSAQVQSIYSAYRKHLFTALYIDTLPFYGKAEYIYYVDEYVKFSSIEDIFREYIRPVQMYKRDKTVVPFIFRESDRTLFSNNPMVFIDQVPIFNMAQLMSLNPAKIERIDVINRSYYLQKQSYDGVISVFTKTKDPADYLNRNAAVYDFKGIQSPANFYSPQYGTAEQRNSRLPDFRNVLYWSPRLTLNSSRTIEFYSSDLDGEYAVVIQGMTFNGEPCSKIITFKVE